MSLLNVLGPGLPQLGARWRMAVLVFAVAVLAGPGSAAAARKASGSKRGSKGAHHKVGGARRGPGVNLPPLRDGAGGAVALSGSKPPGPAQATSPVVQAPPPAVKAPPVVARAAPPPPKGKAGRKGAKAAPTDEDLLEEAQAAYVRGERGRAIEMAQAVAERGGPTSPSAWRFIGLAACSVRQQRLATRAYQNLQSQADQRVISDACKHNGLSYRDEQFVGD